MVTEVYFIEGLYLYTEVGSSGRGVLASRESFVQGPLVVHCQRGASLDALLVVDIPGECPGERI